MVRLNFGSVDYTSIAITLTQISCDGATFESNTIVQKLFVFDWMTCKQNSYEAIWQKM